MLESSRAHVRAAAVVFLGVWLVGVSWTMPNASATEAPPDDDGPAGDGCCAPNDAPCGIPACGACLCELQAECCGDDLPASCFELASAPECAEPCGCEEEPADPAAPCCGPADPPGCGDATCEACVCDADPFCCETSWDLLCSSAANGACAESCGCGEPVPPLGGGCCQASGAPGCGEASCEACVCAAEPFCCEVGWDPTCADAALGPCWESCPCAVGVGEPAGCAFPAPCLGVAQVGEDGECAPVPTGFDPAAPGCDPGVTWDLARCQAGPAGSTVRFVLASAPPGGTGAPDLPLNDIQDAVTLSSPGDTVCVGAGTYVESVVVDRPLRIVGACAATTAIEQGGVRVVQADGVEIHQIAVRLSPYGGISVVKSRWLTVKGCLLERNRPANVLLHDSLTGGLPGPAPSQCGCGLQANLDLCDLVVRWAGAGGAGILAGNVDDLSVLRAQVEGNAGPGLLTDSDAIRVRHSRFVGNRVGVVLRDPRETVLVQNNEASANLEGGFAFLRRTAAAPAVTLRVESNLANRNGGWGVAALDTSGAAARLYAVLRGNALLDGRRAGALLADLRADVLENLIEGTYGVPADPMEAGRGLELARPQPGSRVGQNTVRANAGGGALLVAGDGVGAPGELLAAVSGNTVEGNGQYGLVLSAVDPDAPSAPCAVTTGGAGCPSLLVHDNVSLGNVGAALTVQFAPVALQINDNQLGSSAFATQSQPGGPVMFSYGVVLDGAQFSFEANSLTGPVTPTAQVLVQGPISPSEIGQNTYGAAPGSPEVALNSGTADELGVPPGTFVVENAALPMPCFFYPVPTAVDAAAISSF